MIAQVVSSLLSGSLAQLLGLWFDPVWSLRVPLLIGTCFLGAAIIPLMRFEEMQKSIPKNLPKRILSNPLSILKGRGNGIRLIVQFSVSSSFIGFGAGLVIPYINLYFAERFHIDKAAIGVVLGCAQACTALAIIVGPAIARRIGPVKAAVAFQLASIPFLLITAFATSVWPASGAVIARNALMNCANPIQDSIMMGLVSEDLRSISVSIGQSLWSLGSAIMGPVSTNTVHHFGAYTGYAIVFTGTAILYFIGAIYYLVTFRKHESELIEGS